MRKRVKTVPVQGYIELTLKITREDDGYVAVCEELGVSTCDDSLDSLLNELKALILQHLNALDRNGVRESFFKKHGIHLHRTLHAASCARTLQVRPGEMIARLTEAIPAARGA